MPEGSIQIGELRLLPHRELRRGDAALPIGGRALAVLSELAAAGGELVSKDELFLRIWPDTVVEDNALQAQVSQLRRILGTEAARLVAVHGRGYRLEVDPPAMERPAEAERASIAVLPFDNLTANPDHAYLADGLAEELISRLSRVVGLNVPARTSSFAYRGKATDVRTIAGELGVATVLEGSVRAGGDRLRVSAQLIDAADGFHLWAQSFDRTMTDLLTLQDDLAEAIAAALSRELGPRIRETHSAEAMRLVLKARSEARSLRAEGLDEAARLARAALDLDAGFAKAWESLAGTTFVMAGWGFAPADAFTDARHYAEKAIDLDPRLGSAHAIIAGIEANAGRFVEAVEGFDLARDLDPNNGLVCETAALSALLPTGMIARVTELADASIMFGPARAMPHLIQSSCALLTGEVARARRHLDDAVKTGEVTSRFLVEFLRWEIALGEGDHRGAAVSMASATVRELAVPGAAGDVEAIVAALAGAGDRAAARNRAIVLFDAADHRGTLWRQPANPGFIMTWHVRLGALDAAFAAAGRIVERWRETGRLAVASLTQFWLPDMLPFRRDPRFQDLVRELDLIRFWERHGPPDGHALVEGKLVCLQ